MRSMRVFGAVIVAGGLFAFSQSQYGLAAEAPAAPAPATQPAEDPVKLAGHLGDDDFHARRDAAAKLKALGKAAVPALREAVKSTDPEVHARAAELLQEIDHPAVAAGPVPQPTGYNSRSVSVSVNNGQKVVELREPGRTTHIEENAGGIVMKVTGQLDGKEVAREYKAQSADQLQKENPDAFALYQQTAGGGINFQILGGGGGNQIFVRGGLNIQPIPAPAVRRPGVGDDVQRLSDRIRQQMKDKALPQGQQDEIEGLLKRLSDSLIPANAGANDVDAQMREYNARCDALRKRLAELDLPDPGEALPPPPAGRLGIAAMEETVDGQGLVVTHVMPGSRAEKIGLKEQDVLQKVNGQPVHSTQELRKLITEHPKDLVLEASRDGKPVKLEEHEAKPQ